MATELNEILVGGVGALIGGTITHFFQVYSAARQERREINETHLLQLQDALESLCYRCENLVKHGGGDLMAEDYHRDTSLYAIGCVLAYEVLLVSKGIYAKLRSRSIYAEFRRSLDKKRRSTNAAEELRFKSIDETLRAPYELTDELKTRLHQLNGRLDDDKNFFHYHRLQLAEMLLKDGAVVSYTEFLARVGDPAFQTALKAAEAFLCSASPKRLSEIRSIADELIKLLQEETKVPSALLLKSKPEN